MIWASILSVLISANVYGQSNIETCRELSKLVPDGSENFESRMQAEQSRVDRACKAVAAASEQLEGQLEHYDVLEEDVSSMESKLETSYRDVTKIIGNVRKIVLAISDSTVRALNNAELGFSSHFVKNESFSQESRRLTDEYQGLSRDIYNLMSSGNIDSSLSDTVTSYTSRATSNGYYLMSMVRSYGQAADLGVELLSQRRSQFTQFNLNSFNQAVQASMTAGASNSIGRTIAKSAVTTLDLSNAQIASEREAILGITISATERLTLIERSVDSLLSTLPSSTRAKANAYLQIFLESLKASRINVQSEVRSFPDNRLLSTLPSAFGKAQSVLEKCQIRDQTAPSSFQILKRDYENSMRILKSGGDPQVIQVNSELMWHGIRKWAQKCQGDDK